MTDERKPNEYGMQRGPLGLEYCSHPERSFCDCDACHSDAINRTKEYESEATREAKRKERNRRARINRHERNQAMRDLGLVKVRGALGGTYYE